MTAHGATPRDDISAPPAAPVLWDVFPHRSWTEPVGSVSCKSWIEARAEARLRWAEHAETLVVVERGGRVA
jgi:hypothetical protein